MDRELQFQVEQFYYREARLLDERRYQDWLALVCEDATYSMPGRYVPQRDPNLRGSQDFLAVEAEMQGDEVDSLPLREENYFVLALRVDRAFKQNSWGDNPPARTRRHITNVELLERDAGELRVCSNFLLHYSRHGRDNFLYSGQRRDTLREVEGDFRIARREVILDWNVITAPTAALFF